MLPFDHKGPRLAFLLSPRPDCWTDQGPNRGFDGRAKHIEARYHSDQYGLNPLHKGFGEILSIPHYKNRQDAKIGWRPINIEVF